MKNESHETNICPYCGKAIHRPPRPFEKRRQNTYLSGLRYKRSAIRSWYKFRGTGKDFGSNSQEQLLKQYCCYDIIL